MKKLLSLIAAVAICSSVAGCSGCSSTNTEEEVDNTSEGTEKTAIVMDAVDEDADGLMDIKTEYGVLYYPSKWEDCLLTNEAKSEVGVLTVVFSAKLDDAEYPLFTVTICDEEGDSVGSVTDDGGTTRNVFVEASDLGDISSLDEETQNQLYAMQEGVNNLTAELD